MNLKSTLRNKSIAGVYGTVAAATYNSYGYQPRRSTIQCAYLFPHKTADALTDVSS